MNMQTCSCPMSIQNPGNDVAHSRFCSSFVFHNVSVPKHDVFEQYICLFQIHLALRSIWFLFRLVISLSKMHRLGSHVWALAFLAWSNVFRHDLSLTWLLKVRLLYVHWVQGPWFRIRFEKGGIVYILRFFFLFAHFHQSVFVYRYNSPIACATQTFTLSGLEEKMFVHIVFQPTKCRLALNNYCQFIEPRNGGQCVNLK